MFCSENEFKFECVLKQLFFVLIVFLNIFFLFRKIIKIARLQNIEINVKNV